MPFLKLGLSQQLVRAVEKSGFTQPTAVQEKVIPLVLEYRDVMALAQTGSGKSASFVLPILQLWAKKLAGQIDIPKKAKIRALILTPTRELTLQVAETFSTLGTFLPIKPKVVSVIGGEGLGDQMFALQQGCDIVVATSGRLLEIVAKKQIDLSHLDFFVLDEADKMLNLGFAQELELVLNELPKNRQNLLFSATYPQKMLDFAAKITTKAVEVTIESQTPVVESIVQRVIEVNPENRGPLLRHLLDTNPWEQVLVFMANKRAAENIAQKFRSKGYKADAFHGDLAQEDRNYTIKAFKEKKFRILFATDIAGRGLDIEGIACVINFDLPRSPADYIHRIGRTGRAGKKGEAISFIGHDEQEHFALIEKRSQIKLDRERIAGFELTGVAPLKVRGQLPVKGKGKSKKDKLREQARKDAKQGSL